MTWKPRKGKAKKMPDSRWEIHRDERAVNKQAWEKKPRLRKEYGRLYKKMKERMAPGPSLEIGSGMGNIKMWIPEITTSERDLSEDVDRQETAYRLNYRAGELGNIVAMDVWHHLEFPARALGEWRRCLRPGGRVILMEPAMGLLGQIIYGLVHHEPVGWRVRFGGAEDWSDEKEAYFACQSSGHRHFLKKENPDILAGWKLETEEIAAVAYMTTGGFSKPELGPEWVASAIRGLEPALEQLPRLFATRLLVILERE